MNSRLCQPIGTFCYPVLHSCVKQSISTASPDCRAAIAVLLYDSSGSLEHQTCAREILKPNRLCNAVHQFHSGC